MLDASFLWFYCGEGVLGTSSIGALCLLAPIQWRSKARASAESKVAESVPNGAKMESFRGVRAKGKDS